jgi:sigma-B regulation protein RsbU (phosphoserine phosphatase)
LHELGREFASILDRKKLLERVADRIQRLIHYDVFTVMMWNEESRLLEPQLAVYRDGRNVSTAMPTGLGEGICGTAAALRQTLRVPNVQLDPRYIDCVRDQTMHSELAVPMYVKDRLVGVLDLESASYDAFTPQHEHAVSTLAASLAIALENARLYGRLQEDEQRLATDLSTAREIQKQLLPKTTPWLPGLQVAFAYRPANHLGGDFYDIRPYGEGRVAIAAADVSGKATSAALYGSLAVGMLRRYQEEALRPGALLRDMNLKLLELGIPNRFLAMALALYDAGDRSLVLANSGLPHPYLIRGGQVRSIQVEGVPLGLLPDRRYEEELVTLEIDDVVVIATDGIDESHNRKDEEFGGERVRETLEELAGGSARAIADGLLAASLEWAGGAEAWDDSTVVVLKAV